MSEATLRILENGGKLGPNETCRVAEALGKAAAALDQVLHAEQSGSRPSSF